MAFVIKNKYSFYYLLAVITLYIFLKLLPNDFILGVFDFGITALPFLIIISASILAYIRTRHNTDNSPEEAERIRKKFFITILQMMVITLLFYILYSPQSFHPYLEAFQRLAKLLSFENYFLLLIYLAVLTLAGTLIQIFVKAYLKSQGFYHGSIRQTTKNSLYALFFIFLLIFGSSVAVYPEAYTPVGEYLSGAFTANQTQPNQSGISTLATAFSKSLKNLKNNLAYSNQDAAKNIQEATTILTKNISSATADVKNNLINDIGDKLDLNGGTVDGKLTVNRTLTVGGTTNFKDIVPQDDGSYDIGSASKGWGNAYISRLHGSSPIIVGDLSSAHNLSSSDDFIISGNFEVRNDSYFDGESYFTRNIDLGGNRILNIGDPQSATDSANKQYVDNQLGAAAFVQRVGTTLSAVYAGDSWDLTSGLVTINNLNLNGVLSAGNIGAHNLGLVTFTNGAITGVTSLTASGNLSAGTISGVTTATIGTGNITILDLGANTITDGYLNGDWTGVTSLMVDNINLNGNTISATNNSGLALYDNASNGIFVEDGGNVGIGTTNPGYALDVNGNVNIASGNTYKYNGSDVIATDGNGGKIGLGNTYSSSSFAVGASNVSTGTSNSAIGIGNSATGILLASAIGYSNTASGMNGVAIGYSNQATATSSVAIGNANQATAANSVAMGFGVINNIASSAMFGASDTAKLTILSTGNVGIGTTAPEFKLTLDKGTTTPDGGILSIGTFGSGTTLTTAGAGTRMIWYPKKAAFRAGNVDGTQWDDASIGNYSTALGMSSLASGQASTAIGWYTNASGNFSVAMGSIATASGAYSTAMGRLSTASGQASTATGSFSTASGYASTATGWYSIASGYASTATGWYSIASGTASIAMGQYLTAGSADNTIVLGKGVDASNYLVNNTANSLAIGFNSTIPTFFVGPSSGIGTTGNVGIGTTVPTALLHLNDIAGIAGKVSLEINSNKAVANATDNILMLRSDVASADDPVFRVQANGLVYADGAYTGTGADYAEYFKTTDTNLTPGEAVCVDTQKDNAVKRCLNSGDNNVMGVVSKNPSIIGNSDTNRDKDPNYKVIAMLGQISANISNENGSVQIGDSLTSASTPGYLRKADAGESTVGVALQKFEGTNGSIQVLISRRNKSLTVEKVEEAVTQRIAEMNVADQVNTMVNNATEQLTKNTTEQTQAIASLQIQITDLTKQLQTQIDELKAQTNPDLTLVLAKTDLNIQDIAYLKLVLGLNDKTPNDINIAGVLTAKEIKTENLETNNVTINNADKDAAVVGSVVIAATKTKTTEVTVNTTAIGKDSSRLMVTPISDKPLAWSVSEDKDKLNFTLKLAEPSDKDVSFNWWIIGEK